MRVLILGAGKMVGAMLTGLKGSVDMSEWGIYSPSGVTSQDLAKKVGARVVTHPKEFRDPDWILVGCKPQQLKELRLIIGDQFRDALFVSVLAAISEKNQLEILSAKKMIRVMPNLPVKVRSGVLLLSSESAPAELSELKPLFESIGKAVVVSESELEELTLLTGSGPAFFFEFALELSRLSRSLTLSQREELARSVLEGAGLMLKEDDRSLENHVQAVTSKGGVTIAVLEKWREFKWGEVLKSGFESGRKRAQEIRETLRRS